MKKPPVFVLALGGGTASGKTTIAHMLSERTGALHLSHDRYYVDAPDPEAFNYDHPDALDTERLVSDLGTLREGAVARLPIYDFKSHRRVPQPEAVEPKQMVVVEGILALHDARVRALSDLTVYVDAADDIRLARRLLRDIAERGRTPHQVIDQYLKTVRPMHLTYVAPSRAHAEMVVSGEGELEDSVTSVLHAIRVAGGPVEG